MFLSSSKKIKYGFLVFLFTVILLTLFFQKAEAENEFGPYETFKKEVLNGIDGYYDHNFVTIIGIDSSGSMEPPKNSLINARKIIQSFIQDNFTSGDECYLFHFGPEPYPYYEKTLIPSDTGEAYKEIGEIQGKIISLGRNYEKGTDLNYATYHALSMIEKDKSKNYLIILLTDNDIDHDLWINKGDNKSRLDKLNALIDEKGGKIVKDLLPDKTLCAYCFYYIGNTDPIEVPDLPDYDAPPESNKRKEGNRRIFRRTPAPTPGPGETPAAGQSGEKIKLTLRIIDGSSQKPLKKYDLTLTKGDTGEKMEPSQPGEFYLEPGSYNINVKSRGYTPLKTDFNLPPGTSDTSQDIPLYPESSFVGIIICILLLLVIVAIVAFFIVKPISVTVDMTPGGEEKKYTISFNDFVIIGGEEGSAKNVYTVSGHELPLTRITHIFPQKLCVTRLTGDNNVKIILDSETSLDAGSENMSASMDIEFADRLSGSLVNITVLRGGQDSASPPAEAGDDDFCGDFDDGGSWDDDADW